MPRLILAVLSVLLAASAARAEDIITRDGTTYADVEIRLVEPDGITIKHSEGLIKIHARHLSDSDRARFHLTPEAARAYAMKRQRAVAAREQAIKDAEEEAKHKKEMEILDEALRRRGENFRLYCISSTDGGVYCRDKKDRTYFIKGYTAMPQTWFEVFAVKLQRIQIGPTVSAVELLPVAPPLKR